MCLCVFMCVCVHACVCMCMCLRVCIVIRVSMCVCVSSIHANMHLDSWLEALFQFQFLLVQEARTMLLKGVALWLPSCRQWNKEEEREMEGWEEKEEEEEGKEEGASASVLMPASTEKEEV